MNKKVIITPYFKFYYIIISILLIIIIQLPCAFAQGAPVAQPQGYQGPISSPGINQPLAPHQPSFSEVLVKMAPMFLVVMLVFHFFIIKPQKKKEDEQSKFLKGLKSGESVVTSGGIIGQVVGPVGGDIVTLEVSPGVKMKFEVGHVLKKKEK